MESEMEICSNCKREIPSVNYVMHSVHCHRNIALCPKCDKPVPRSKLQEHDQNEHRKVPCKTCGQFMENSLIAEHEAEKCPQRRMTCPYCDLDLVAGESTDHENYCGSRTEKCKECGEFIMIKYRGLHLDCNHGLSKSSEHSGCCPSSQSPSSRNNAEILIDENMDRLLALRLLREDMEAATDLRQRGGLPLGSMSAFMTDSDDEDELAAAIVDDDPFTPKLSFEADQQVKLPCEFCDVLVPANRLVMHQLACEVRQVFKDNTHVTPLSGRTLETSESPPTLKTALDDPNAANTAPCKDVDKNSDPQRRQAEQLKNLCGQICVELPNIKTGDVTRSTSCNSDLAKQASRSVLGGQTREKLPNRTRVLPEAGNDASSTSKSQRGAVPKKAEKQAKTKKYQSPPPSQS